MPTSTVTTEADVLATSGVPADAAGLLAAARGERRAADRAEARLLRLAVEWVVAHPADGVHTFPATVYVGGEDTELAIAGDGCPLIAEFAVPEFAAAVGLGTEAGKGFLGEALELAYRLPRLWRRVQGGDLPAWKARRVARETIGNALSREAARKVPALTAERVALRDRTCVFPWCTRPARACDTDHVIPHGQPGGVTCPCNLAPLCRRHHRLKTHSPWTYLVLDPGTFLWTSPHGYQFLRDQTGTLDVREDRPRTGRPPDG